MARPSLVPGWLVATVAVTIGANRLAGFATWGSVEAMRSLTPFATEVRGFELAIMPWWVVTAYTLVTLGVLWWLAPVAAWSRRGWPPDPPAIVQRRTVAAPVILGASGFAAWVASVVIFPVATVWRFGRWSPELMSQQVLSPLVNGFLAATVTYLVVDGIFRRWVVPRVFPAGRLASVGFAPALGIRGRLLVFLVAVAFLPLFTVLGLVRAAGARIAAGLSVDLAMTELLHATEITFMVYVLLGAVLTQLFAGTVTRPLAAVAAVLRRVREGDVSHAVEVTAADELGVVEDGVNALVGALCEKERILDTFGRVVEPSVRDRLLAGTLAAGGELRCVTILVCDLRGFTRLAETTPPTETVATLNEFFAAMTTVARGSGGVVDKFVGDALLVVFGLADDLAPAVHAAAALGCAERLCARLGDLNAARVAGGRPPLAMKVALHTGEVVAGTVGAADRHDYTVVGDAVNVAVRLEALCGEQGRDLLVSEVTWSLASGEAAVATRAPAAGITLAPVGTVTLRGRGEPVRVFGRGAVVDGAAGQR